jgi:glyoxalase family protein
MAEHIGALHHVTAFAGDPARNLDFYAKVLGLRLVKRTVNFDDPGTWHLYYGDGAGTPGSILTFFPVPGLPRGHRGTGQATETAFSVPPASLPFWRARLARLGVPFAEPGPRFGAEVIALEDPDGMALELVADPAAAALPGAALGDIPAEHAVRGFFGVTLRVRDAGRTAQVLVSLLGYAPGVEEEGRIRFTATRGDGALAAVVDLVEAAGGERGEEGAGSVHHIAFRVGDVAAQEALRRRIAAAGHRVTPILDRQYFRSIYFREPNGVLFEVASDPPGFAVDEPAETMGERLMLPAWLEPQRAQIERVLPALERRSAFASQGAGNAVEAVS